MYRNLVATTIFGLLSSFAAGSTMVFNCQDGITTEGEKVDLAYKVSVDYPYQRMQVESQTGSQHRVNGRATRFTNNQLDTLMITFFSFGTEGVDQYFAFSATDEQYTLKAGYNAAEEVTFSCSKLEKN